MEIKFNPLDVPNEESVRYSTNYIKTAVCELRFPTLLELENSPPNKLQSALRKDYPYYNVEQSVSINLGSAPTSGKGYIFESKKRDWAITLKPSTLSLETNKYTDFNDFIDRFTAMVNAAKDLLDTDFFTRVGLRYINHVPLPGNHMDRKDIANWINPVLVAPLTGGELGTLSTFRCEVGGHLKDGGYTFSHGFTPPTNNDRDSLLYMLDYDYFKDGVEFDDVSNVITQFNKQNFNLFKWSLGDEAKKALGAGEKKT